MTFWKQFDKMKKKSQKSEFSHIDQVKSSFGNPVNKRCESFHVVRFTSSSTDLDQSKQRGVRNWNSYFFAFGLDQMKQTRDVKAP